MSLFPQTGAASRTMMTGEADTGVHLPQVVDLFISNPPYTRAGGPGDTANTEWNPLFGSVLSKSDSNKMTTALRKTLNSTCGSLYAGLGSAFMALIDQEIKAGKMLAVVLPLTAVTGSRWQVVRQTLLDGYVIEWVITSHDPRNRAKKAALPGRRWVSFSESTRIAETLIVARKAAASGAAARSDDHRVKFVNLRHNPDDPADSHPFEPKRACPLRVGTKCGALRLGDCGSSTINFAARPQNRMARTMFLPTPMTTGASSRPNTPGSSATTV